MKLKSVEKIKKLIGDGSKLPLAIKNYPSRGQTSVQDLYQTSIGKLFLKKVSRRNHEDCQVDPKSGSLAEREYWAYLLAEKIGLVTPELMLIDENTTVQRWLDYPDGHTFKQSKGAMDFQLENIFNCALYDWLTGQIDRHDANYLYDYVNQSIILVDSAHAFLKYDGSLPDYLHLFEIGNKNEVNLKIDSQILKNILSLTNDVLLKIVPLNNLNEKEALINRKERLSGVTSIKDIVNLYRR